MQTTKLLGFEHDDGGRSRYFKGSKVGDCVPRAIAIATGLDYQVVYDGLTASAREYAATSHSRVARKIKSSGATPRNGTWPEAYKPYLASLGWVWTPTMSIGSGTTVHLRAGQLPTGRVIVRASKHLLAVVDGVMRDTYRSDRDGTRAVYGYWTPGGAA